MDKEIFIKMMKELVAIKQDEDNLQEAFKKFEPEFNRISFSRYENLVIKSLKAATDDKWDWISYWLYDCNCGTKDGLLNSVKDKNGKQIKLKTLSQLYDLIKTKDL